MTADYLKMACAWLINFSHGLHYDIFWYARYNCICVHGGMNSIRSIFKFIFPLKSISAHFLFVLRFLNVFMYYRKCLYILHNDDLYICLETQIDRNCLYWWRTSCSCTYACKMHWLFFISLQQNIHFAGITERCKLPARYICCWRCI